MRKFASLIKRNKHDIDYFTHVREHVGRFSREFLREYAGEREEMFSRIFNKLSEGVGGREGVVI